MENLTMVQEMLKTLKTRKNHVTEQFSKDKTDAYMKQQCSHYNAMQGNLQGYDCAVCKNKGSVAVYENRYELYRECKCMGIRRNLQRIEKSGLKLLLHSCSFEKYKAEENWQKAILKKAMSYVNDHENRWFYIGGQVGCGKTHICTAIVSEFLNMGIESKYMLWRDEVVPLKAVITNDEAYEKGITPLKNVPVLYIDDFFKTERGKKPTTSEINIAFEILNYRYNNQGFVTLISSEYNIDDLMEIDEAVGSRIYQKTKEYCICIGHDINKNYRMH